MTTEQQDRRKQQPSVETLVRIAAQTIKQELNILTDDEHAFLKAWIVREQRAEERWEKIKTQVLGFAALAFTGWLGTVILNAVKRGGQ